VSAIQTKIFASRPAQVARKLSRPLLAGLERGDFDLVAVGRALIANPDWPHRVRNGTPLIPYSLNMLQPLV